jgi:hypothetical protein
VAEENSPDRQLESRAAAEAGIIVGAFRTRIENKIAIGVALDSAGEDGDMHANGIAFMYAKDRILTREQYLGGKEEEGEEEDTERSQSDQSVLRPIGVLDILQDEGVGFHVTRLVRDIVLIRLDPNQIAEGREPDVRGLLQRIDDELGVGIATPDQVLTASQVLSPCSATEPQPVSPFAGPRPPVCPDGGARVRVFVADTGLVKNAATTFPWLAGVLGGGPDGGDDPGNSGNTPSSAILSYGGHGTFVAGVLRCLAPDAQVHVERIFDTAGSALESEVVTRLNASFDFGFEILHLTASCMTRKNIPLIALEAWLEQLRAYRGVVCVAPAGNSHTRRPSWPGAFPNVLSVGALAADCKKMADFSNYGGWVDVYAPGENLINAFGSGTYTYQFQLGTCDFTGLAQWSGTSFSAPIVTGLIAARMARCGESAREAATALLARARDQAIPGVGPILLPSCGGEDGECREDRGRCGDGGCCHGRCGGHGCGDHRCGGNG